jgi:hypothetical protein
LKTCGLQLRDAQNGLEMGVKDIEKTVRKSLLHVSRSSKNAQLKLTQRKNSKVIRKTG